MFTCANCGKAWPENYCPACARTIERSEASQPPTPFGVGPLPTGAVPAHTKQCSYCGQENEAQAANCIQCGTDEFVVPKPKVETVAGRAAPPGDRHRPADVEYRKLLVQDPSSEEKADFARRLAAATPQAWVTYSLVALNVIIFLALSVNSGTLLGAPLLELLKWGADFGPLTVNGQQWWRLLTSCFLHLGLLHLACNMYALLLAGKLTEQLFGNWFFLLLYLGCGLTASLASIWFNPALVSVGASGAIFGVYGGLLGYLAREGGGLPRSLVAPVAKSATVFIAWNLVYGFLDWVNHTANETINSLNHTHSHGNVIDLAAHAGGLLAGLVFGYLGARPLELGPRRSLAPGRACVLALGIGSVMALLLIPVLKSNPADIPRLKQLGELYYRGEGVAKNPAAAVRWLQQAADQGDLSSQNLLGSMYYQGDGVRKDIAVAAQWFIKAAAQGDVNAEKFLAGVYLRGEGVPTNTAEGLKWLAKVGNQGDLEVEKLLAATYFRGDGVAKDVAEAVKWARQVGEQGDLPYQKILAGMYYRGEGVAPDKAEAAKWYRLAANQGDTNAQTVLGLMCAKGEGIEPNPIEALKWLTLCGNKHAQVEQQRQTLERELSAGQQAEVQQAVQKFLRLQARRQTH